MIKDKPIIKPIIKSIVWTFVMLIFPVASGIITQVLRMSSSKTMFIQGCFMFISLIIPIIYMHKLKVSFKKIGLIKIANESARKVLFFLPLVIAEMPLLLFGINLNSINYITTLLFFTLAVGISEEVYFRGIIFKLLEEKYPIKRAIIISALVFGLGHSASILAGGSIIMVLLQVFNALVFGIIATEIVIITKSLFPTIIWHMSFDFVNHITLATGINDIIVCGAQEIIMIIYAYYLWHKISLKSPDIVE